MNNKIGLIILGTKGGLNILCKNEAVTKNDKEVFDSTNRDLRDYIRVNKAGIPYYVIEHTPKYKIITECTSCIENQARGGGFVAISLYIPHELKVINVFDLLNKLTATYKEKYLDSETFKMLNVAENIEDFTSTLDTAKVINERKRFTSLPNKHQPTAIAKYNTTDKLKSYLEAPYSKELIEHTSVIFVEEKILDGNNSYLGSWPRTPLYIDNITPQSEGISFIKSSNIIVANAILNGVLLSEDEFFNQKFLEDDNIEIVLQKKYQKDFSIAQTTIDRGVNRYWEKKHDNYVWANIPFQPEIYKIRIIVEGINQQVDFDIWDDNTKIATSSNGQFAINGNDIGKTIGIKLKNEKLLIKNEKITNPNSHITIELIEIPVELKYENIPSTGKIDIQFNKSSISLNTLNLQQRLIGIKGKDNKVIISPSSKGHIEGDIIASETGYIINIKSKKINRTTENNNNNNIVSQKTPTQSQSSQTGTIKQTEKDDYTERNRQHSESYNGHNKNNVNSNSVNSDNDNKSKKKKRLIAVFTAIIIFFILGCIIGYFFGKKGGSGNGEEKQHSNKEIEEKKKEINALEDKIINLEDQIKELKQTNNNQPNNDPIVDNDPPKNDPPKNDPPKNDPPKNDPPKNDPPKKTEIPNIQKGSVIIDKNIYIAIGTLACQQKSLNKVMEYLKNYPNAKTFKIDKSTISRTDLQDKTDAIQHLLNVLETQGNRPDQKQDFERWYINNKKHFSTGSNNDVNSQQQKAIEMIIKNYDDFKNSSDSFNTLLKCGEKLGFLKVTRTKKATTVKFK